MKAFIISLLIFRIIPGSHMEEYHTPGLYITYDTGTVLNETGDGLLTTPGTDSFYNYIKYKEGSTPGDNITTICIYNPLTLYGDDIIVRFDF